MMTSSSSPSTAETTSAFSEAIETLEHWLHQCAQRAYTLEHMGHIWPTPQEQERLEAVLMATHGICALRIDELVALQARLVRVHLLAKYKYMNPGLLELAHAACLSVATVVQQRYDAACAVSDWVTVQQCLAARIQHVHVNWTPFRSHCSTRFFLQTWKAYLRKELWMALADIVFLHRNACTAEAARAAEALLEQFNDQVHPLEVVLDVNDRRFMASDIERCVYECGHHTSVPLQEAEDGGQPHVALLTALELLNKRVNS
jgi:hypothetical protein